MTDRLHSLTVVLERDMLRADAEGLLEAIRRLRGVQSVTGHVSTIETHMAEERARRDLGEKLWRVLYPKDGDK